MPTFSHYFFVLFLFMNVAANVADIKRQLHQKRDTGISWSEIYSTMKKNAAKRDIPFSLTRTQFDRLVERSCGSCMMTGIPFESKWYGGFRRPFMPSVDRIDSSKGYTEGNVRLVCVLVNLALNEWGAEPLLRVARNLVARENEVRAQEEEHRSRKRWQAVGYVTVKEYLIERDALYTPLMLGQITRNAKGICQYDGIEWGHVWCDVGKPRKDGTYRQELIAVFPTSILDRCVVIEEDETDTSLEAPNASID